MTRWSEDYWTPREAEDGYAPQSAVLTDEGVYRVWETPPPSCGECGGAGGHYDYEADGLRYQRVWEPCLACGGSGHED